jgi:serine/threonine protein kinase
LNLLSSAISSALFNMAGRSVILASSRRWRLALLLGWLSIAVRVVRCDFNYEIVLHVNTAINAFVNGVANSMNVITQNLYTDNCPALSDHVEFSRSQLFSYMKVYTASTGIHAAYFALASDGGFGSYAFSASAPYKLTYLQTDVNRYYTNESDSSLRLYYYYVKGDGEPIDLYGSYTGHTNISFDPRTRPWYIPVAATHVKMWSTPYIDALTGYPTITLVYPIMNTTYLGGDHSFVGTVAVDLLVTQLNQFLTLTYETTAVVVFVVDKPTGYLLGNSFNVPMYTTNSTTGVKQMELAVDCPNALISEATKLMIRLNWTKDLTIFSNQYYLQAVQYQDDIQGLTWHVVILMPTIEYPYVLLAPNPYYFAALTIASVTLFANILALCVIAWYWKTETIKLTQPIFTLLVLTGGVMMSILCFLLMGQNTDELCFLRPYLFNLCFTWCMAPLLIKGWLVHKKFHQMSFEEFETSKLVKFSYRLFLAMASFILFDLFILCIFLYAVGGADGKGTNPVTITQVTSSGAYTSITQCAYVTNSGLRSSEIAYKTVIVFFSCLYGYLNKRIPGLIAGSKHLLILVYNVALTSMVTVIVTDTFVRNDLIIFSQVLGVCYCVLVNSTLLVVPYVYQIYDVGDEGAAAQVHKDLRKGENKDRLKQLPIHFAIVNRLRKGIILSAIRQRTDTVFERVEDKTTMDLALTYGVDIEVMRLLAPLFLPFSDELQPVNPEIHGFGWAALTQLDTYVDAVQAIVEEYPSMCFLLADAADKEGRLVRHIASPHCKEIILKATYFLQRYQLMTSKSSPEYASSATMVHLAIDHDSPSKDHVALKFMISRTDFDREIRVRNDCKFDCQFVVDILDAIDCAMDESIELEFDKHGFDAYRFCIILPAGNRTLDEVLTSETTGDKMDFLRFSSLQLMKVLNHIHCKGYIHGDVKPRNIIRYNDNWALIDLDSAAKMYEEPSGIKIRSAYAPPELIYLEDKKAIVRAPIAGSSPPTSARTAITSSSPFTADGVGGVDGLRIDPLSRGSDGVLPYDLVHAEPSHDCWALGTVLFRMAAGEPLFLASANDEICNGQMTHLAIEDEDWLMGKLEKIDDLLARNMISQMLNFDPGKRPSMMQLMMHPFLTGNATTRLAGEEAEYDVFISYRVHSDAHHAEILYDKLTHLGLKVWWDKKCLHAGENWETGFCNGLVDSRVFVALLSKNAIDHPERNHHCFARLTPQSQCDNVLLEHRLALCLNKRGILSKIFPVMIGERDVGTEEYMRFHFPDLTAVKSVVVASLEKKLREHLSRECLGSPLMPNLSVKDIMDALTRNQGHFILGGQNAAFEKAATSILEMVQSTLSKTKYTKSPRKASLSADPSRARAGSLFPEETITTSNLSVPSAAVNIPSPVKRTLKELKGPEARKLNRKKATKYKFFGSTDSMDSGVGMVSLERFNEISVHSPSIASLASSPGQLDSARRNPEQKNEGSLASLSGDLGESYDEEAGRGASIVRVSSVELALEFNE